MELMRASELYEVTSKEKVKDPKQKIVKEKVQAQAFFEKDFISFLKVNNYSLNNNSISVCVNVAKNFLKIIQSSSKLIFKKMDDLSKLEINHVKQYEEFQVNRSRDGKLKDSTVYHYLKILRVFTNFLFVNKIVDFKYEIPKHLIKQPTRLNDYVETEDIHKFIAFLLNDKDLTVYRKAKVLSFLLILVNTGCRSNEISKLSMPDINFTERAITFYSKKSGLRKLRIHHATIEAIKLYLHFKSKLFPVSGDTLFTTRTGGICDSKYISCLFNLLNKKYFNEQKVTPRALRHTFATNALENGNDFHQVSLAMGHKHWISTQYYLHKSQKRLLDNTLIHNPLSKIGVNFLA